MSDEIKAPKWSLEDGQNDENDQESRRNGRPIDESFLPKRLTAMVNDDDDESEDSLIRRFSATV